LEIDIASCAIAGMTFGFETLSCAVDISTFHDETSTCVVETLTCAIETLTCVVEKSSCDVRTNHPGRDIMFRKYQIINRPGHPSFKKEGKVLLISHLQKLA